MNNVSILICTRNRPNQIYKTLLSISRVIVPKNSGLEVVVVNNGDKDSLDEIVHEFKKKINLKIILEKRIGHSIALNLGIKNCSGNLIIFTDDDVEVDRSFVKNYLDIAKKYPDCGYYFGKIKPVFEKEPPYWWDSLTPRSLSGRDIGEKEIIFKKSCWDADIVGVNFAAKKKIFDYFRFDPFLGSSELTGFLGGNDTKLGREIMDSGKNVCYVPRAVVYHLIPEKRISFEYLKRRKFSIGRASFHFEKESIFRIFYKFLCEFWFYLFACFIRNEFKSKKHELALVKLFGKLTEFFYYRIKLRGLYASLNYM
jgi:glycosyltransferase involved in cell wall biosynthesis